MKPGRDLVLVFGKFDMGKTAWTRQYLATQRRIILLDPVVEYEGFVTFEDPLKMIEHLQRRQNFRVRSIIVPDFEALCKIAYAAQHVTLAIDEAQRCIPPSGLDLPEALGDVIYRGAHTGVSLVLVAQRPSTVHIAARSQFSRLVTFAQSEVADVRWIEGVTGLRIGERVLTLPPLHYIDISGGQAVENHLTFPGQRDRLPSLSAEGSPPESPEGSPFLFGSPGGFLQ